MLDFPSAPDDTPSGAPDQLRHVTVEPDQLESIFEMRAPFLRQKQKTERSVGPDFVPKRIGNLDHRFLGVLPDKNPRCCSRCHRIQSTRWNLRFKSSMMNSQTKSSAGNLSNSSVWGYLEKGMRIVITGGPASEPIDRVRFITNQSTGELAVKLAQSFSAAGHNVELFLGVARAGAWRRQDTSRRTTIFTGC